MSASRAKRRIVERLCYHIVIRCSERGGLLSGQGVHQHAQESGPLTTNRRSEAFTVDRRSRAERLAVQLTHTRLRRPTEFVKDYRGQIDLVVDKAARSAKARSPIARAANAERPLTARVSFSQAKQDDGFTEGMPRMTPEELLQRPSPKGTRALSLSLRAPRATSLSASLPIHISLRSQGYGPPAQRPAVPALQGLPQDREPRAYTDLKCLWLESKAPRGREPLAPVDAPLPVRAEEPDRSTARPRSRRARHARPLPQQPQDARELRRDRANLKTLILRATG